MRPKNPLLMPIWAWLRVTNARVVFHLVAQGAGDLFLVGDQCLQPLGMNMA